MDLASALHSLNLRTTAPSTARPEELKVDAGTSEPINGDNFEMPRSYRTERVLQKHELVGGSANRRFLMIKPNVLLQTVDYVLKLVVRDKSAFFCCIPLLHFFVAFLCCIHLLHSFVAFLCCIPLLHSFDAFFCCIPLMHSFDAFL